MTSLELLQCSDAQACVEVINQLHAAYRQTFKRSTAVGLYASVTFGDARGTKDRHCVIARLPDPGNAEQQWDARWLAAAAKAPAEPSAP